MISIVGKLQALTLRKISIVFVYNMDHPRFSNTASRYYTERYETTTMTVSMFICGDAKCNVLIPNTLVLTYLAHCWASHKRVILRSEHDVCGAKQLAMVATHM